MKKYLYYLCFSTLPFVSMAQQKAEYPLLASFFCCTEELMKIGESEDIALKCIVPNQWYTFELRDEFNDLVLPKIDYAVEVGEATVSDPVIFGDRDNELKTVFFANGTIFISIYDSEKDLTSCTLMLGSIVSPSGTLDSKVKTGSLFRKK